MNEVKLEIIATQKKWLTQEKLVKLDIKQLRDVN